MSDMRWKLLYDGNCRTCTTFARHVRRFDRLKLVDTISLQEHYLEDKTIPIETLLQEVHLLGENGEILQGGKALQKIISLIPEMRPFRWMIESRWGEKGSGMVYRALKKIRSRCRRCGR